MLTMSSANDQSTIPRSRTNIPSLVCAFLASLTTGGATYSFGLYGDSLKKGLALSQSQLDTISTAFFFAGLFSWIPGLCADRFGTRFSLSIGGITGASSAMTYWAVSRQFVELPRFMLVPTLSALGVLVFLSCAMITGSVFKIIVASCGPGSKGSAVGAAKGYVGLGAGAYACIFEAVRNPGESTLDFLPMIAFFFVTCGTIPALLLLPSQEDLKHETLIDEATPAHFRTLFISLLVMATIVIGSSVSELQIHGADHITHVGPSYITATMVLTVWLVPILSLLYLPRQLSEYQNTIQIPPDDKENDGDDILSDTNDHVDAPGSTSVGIKLNTAPDDEEDRHLLNSDHVLAHQETEQNGVGYNLNLAQMLKTPSAHLMLWTTTILVGAGTVETNNMGQMVEALGFSESVTPAALALFSVSQAAARVITGAVSESALNWSTTSFCITRGIPRPFFLVVASMIGSLAHFILGIATKQETFVIGVALAGIAFGMAWPLMVLIVGEVFGKTNGKYCVHLCYKIQMWPESLIFFIVGANYMFYDGFTSAVGTMLLSQIVAGGVYERHINKDAEDKLTCLGDACFRLTHLIVAGLSLTCALTSVLMMYTSRHIYNRNSVHIS